MDDLAAAFSLVSGIAKSATDVRSGWDTLIHALAEHCDSQTVSHLSAVDIARDVLSVHQQLSQLVQGSPPPDDIDALWFGLFDAVDGEGSECIGYYVAGIRGFDEDDPDSRCSPAWWPENRYLSSAALAAVKQAEVEAGRRGADGQRAYLGYAGQLGAALLVSRFGAEGLAGPRRLVVGFDSGDYAVVGA